MSDVPHDPGRPGGGPPRRDAGQANPTVKAFPAVQPDAPPQASIPSSPGNPEPTPAAPSPRELTLAPRRLADEVERLGGDVTEVRYLLRMDRRP